MATAAAQPITVEKLMRRPFAVVRPEIENFEMRDAEPPPDFVDPPSFLMTLVQLNGKPLDASQRQADCRAAGNGQLGSGRQERDVGHISARVAGVES